MTLAHSKRIPTLIQKSKSWRILLLQKRAFGFDVSKSVGSHLNTLANGGGRSLLDENGQPLPLLSLEKKHLQSLALGSKRISSVHKRKQKLSDALEAWQEISEVQEGTKAGLFTFKRVRYDSGEQGQSLISLCTRKACPGRLSTCYNMLGTCKCGGKDEPTSCLLHKSGKPVLARFSAKLPISIVQNGAGTQSEVMVDKNDRRFMAGIPQYFDGACASCCTHTEEHFSRDGQPFSQRVPMVFKGQDLTLFYSNQFDVPCKGPRCRPDLWLYVKPGFYYDKRTLQLLEHVPGTRIVDFDESSGQVNISKTLFGAFVPKQCFDQTDFLSRYFDPFDDSVRVCTEYSEAQKMKLIGLKSRKSYYEYQAPNVSIRGREDKEWDFLKNFRPPQQHVP
jgi:hypothetical protein